MSDQRRAVIEGVQRICAGFDAAYWRKADETGAFPEDFVRALTEAGFLGIAMPVEVGGVGLGAVEAAAMMQVISQSGAGFTGASAAHMNIFAPMPIAVFGTEAQKQRFLPALIKGEDRTCFAVTEPDAGLETARIKTQAVREGDGYVITGRKIWTSAAQRATRALIVARTSPYNEARPLEGLTLFYAPLDRAHVEIREIHKMGRAAVDSNMLFIDGLKVGADERIGGEGEGFKCLLHGLNPERILIGAEAVGLGRAALAKAAAYANERVVFGRPIGQNQAIQHPLAKAWAMLEAADLMVFKAAALYDSGAPCGVEANAAKYLAAEAAYEACETAVMVHGGMGYAKEYDVERYLREAMIPRIAPVSRELILSFIAEKALGLPKSY
ncbi:MAG: acyl-CoA dehydrogenase family protein [Micropepsaceae bacterium]